MPKRSYALLFWGLVLPLFGVSWVTLIGYLLIAIGGFSLGRFTPAFRISAIAATTVIASVGLLILNSTVLAFTLADEALRWVGLGSLILQGAMGWFLMTGVGVDCSAHGHADVAKQARIGRVVYVTLLLGLQGVIPLFRLFPEASPMIWLLPLIAILLGHAVLIWNVQNAKIRLFP